MKHTSMQVPVEGAKIHLDIVGTGHPVVLLHGGPGADSRYLRPQCDRLSQMTVHGEPISLIYYDQRGAERSPLEPGSLPVGYDVHVEDLEELRLALGIQRLTLCGYSWGGLLALLYSLRHKDVVERLILISPAPASESERSKMQQNLQMASQREDVQQFRASVLEKEADLSAEEKRKYRFASVVAGYFFHPELALKLTPFRVIQRVEQAIWQSLGRYDIRAELSTLSSIPSLLLHGRQDVIPFESAKDTAALLGATFVPLDDCGHVPYIEAETALWQSIQEFLQS